MTSARVRRHRVVLGVLIALAATPLPSPAARLGAQSPPDSVVERRTREVSAKLRCPVCQGESILDSPSRLSGEMRDLVREQIRAGRSEDEILDYFEAKYGEWILLEPRMRGANYAVYIIPAIVVLAGLGVVTLAVKRWTRPAGSDVDGAGAMPGRNEG